MAEFWETKALSEMTREEWESLCDGCGKCCLNQLEDEDTGERLYTNVVCRYLGDDCRCTIYDKRSQLVERCMTLTPENLHEIYWLPETCAYALLKKGKPLPDWHPLVTGDQQSVHEAGKSVRNRTICETMIRNDEDYLDHIVKWVR